MSKNMDPRSLHKTPRDSNVHKKTKLKKKRRLKRGSLARQISGPTQENTHAHWFKKPIFKLIPKVRSIKDIV